MQRIEIIGNIGRDAEVKDFNNNQVINFPVAVTERINNENRTIWFEIAKWGNNVAVAPYLKKGTKVFISGKVNNRGYINQQSGDVVIVNGINAFEIELLGDAPQQQNQQQNSAPQRQSYDNTTHVQDAQQYNQEDPEDLPF